jgi:hypothetical protein
MINYQNAKIYKLVANDLVYYGSTCKELKIRLCQHKSKSKYKCQSKLLFETGKRVEIYLVEKCPCNDKIELLARERYYIENNECVNKQLPGRTTKEYYEANKDKIKEYREVNKDKIKEYTKEYYEANKDKINKLHKEYYKEYYEANKEKMSIKITCECGSEVRKVGCARNIKTKKHINYVNNNNI